MTVQQQIATSIIERLELEGYTPESFPRDAVLFAPASEGGLEFDSIACLEIIAALSDLFDLPFDDIQREDMMSVETIARYVIARRPELGS